jgi:hypothetical protein
MNSRFFIEDPRRTEEMKRENDQSVALGTAMYETDLALNGFFQPLVKFFKGRVKAKVTSREDLAEICANLDENEKKADEQNYEAALPLNQKFSASPGKTYYQLRIVVRLVNIVNHLLNSDEKLKREELVSIETLNGIIDVVIHALSDSEKFNRLMGRRHTSQSLAEFDGEKLKEPLSNLLYQIASNLSHRINCLHRRYHQQELLKNDIALNEELNEPSPLPAGIRALTEDGFLTSRDKRLLARANYEGHIIFGSNWFQETFFHSFLHYANSRMQIPRPPVEGAGERAEDRSVLRFLRRPAEPKLETIQMFQERFHAGDYVMRQPLFSQLKLRIEALTKRRFKLIEQRIAAFEMCLNESHEGLPDALPVAALERIAQHLKDLISENTVASRAFGLNYRLGNPFKEGTWRQSALDLTIIRLLNKTNKFIGSLTACYAGLALAQNEVEQDEKVDARSSFGEPGASSPVRPADDSPPPARPAGSLLEGEEDENAVSFTQLTN